MLAPNVFGSRRNHWIDIREHAIVIDGLIIDAHGLLVRLGVSVAYRGCPTRHPTFSRKRPESISTICAHRSHTNTSNNNYAPGSIDMDLRMANGIWRGRRPIACEGLREVLTIPQPSG